MRQRALVRRHYARQGRKPDWMQIVPKCLCRTPFYVHGRFVPCAKERCQRHVDNERRVYLGESAIMAERKKNAAYWKQMKAARSKRVLAYAKKHGITYEQALRELEYYEMLESEDLDFLKQEGLR